MIVWFLFTAGTVIMSLANQITWKRRMLEAVRREWFLRNKKEYGDL